MHPTNTLFERAIAGSKGGFPFVTFADLTEVVGMLQVNLSIHGGFLQAVEKIGDAQKWISVFLCEFVKALKVGTEMERAVFLSSEEDWSAMRQERRSDEPHS